MTLKQQKRSSSSQRFLSPTRLAGLVVGSTILATSGSAWVKIGAALTSGSPVTIDTQAWSRFTQVQFGLKTLDDATLTQFVLSSQAETTRAAPPAVRRAHSHRGRKHLPKTAPLARMTMAELDQKPAAPTWVSPEKAAEDQAATFRSLYRQMRTQFFVAVEGQSLSPSVQMAIHSLTPMPDMPAMVDGIPSHASHPIEAKASRAPATKRRVAYLKPTYGPAPIVTPHVRDSGALALLTPLAGRTGEKPVEESDVTTHRYPSYDAFREQTEATYQQIAELTEKLCLDPSSARPSITVNQGSTQMVVSGAPGYSERVGYSFPPVDQVRVAMNTHRQQISDAEEEALRRAHSTPPEPTPPVSGKPAVVEAFEWHTAIQDALIEVLTHEGWRTAHAANHWPVIYWNSSGDQVGAMVSYNTASMLAKLADAELQPEAAIVFGKIPAGWSVDYSGRAEKPVYLDASNTAPEQVEQVRYFAFVNAAPGAQMVFLKSNLGGHTASVAVPVMNGQSTYLDMTSVSRRTVTGAMLDGAASLRVGVPGVILNVVGQPGTVSITDTAGTFQMGDVYVVGDFPLYLDAVTTNSKGYKHRYRLGPDQWTHAELFRLTEGQVDGWRHQLEGNLSPDGGMVVGMMPQLTKKFGDGRLFPWVQPLLPNAALKPESYVVREDGVLDVGKPLEQDYSTFVSVQVPEGPVVAQLEDNNRNVVWSELVYAQPNVINVVGRTDN